jgi:hypothetical protein
MLPLGNVTVMGFSAIRTLRSCVFCWKKWPDMPVSAMMLVVEGPVAIWVCKLILGGLIALYLVSTLVVGGSSLGQGGVGGVSRWRVWLAW